MKLKAAALMLLLMIAHIVPAFSDKDSSSVNTRQYDDLLEEAFQYSEIYNYEKAVSLTGKVLSDAENPRIIARAHWINAVAYGKYMLEYRTDEFMQEFDSEVEAVKKLNPDMIQKEIVRLKINLDLVLSKEDAGQFLEEAVNKWQKDSESDGDVAWNLGASFYIAAMTVDSQDRRKEYLEKATQYLEKAYKADKRNYERAIYYLTALFETGRNKESLDLVEDVSREFQQKPEWSFEGPPDYYQRLISGNKSDDTKQTSNNSRHIDMRTRFDNVMNDARKESDHKKRIRILSEFIESREIKKNLPIYVSALYKLAHFQVQAGRLEEAVKTYETIESVSPWYAETQMNIGIVYMMLADKASEKSVRDNYLKKAMGAFKIQEKHNWHGGSAKRARELSSKCRQMLESDPS